MKKVEIHTEYIKLCQLLKWISEAESGAHAGNMIAEGTIKVNDKIERRRGKKIFPGDRITIGNNRDYLVESKGSAPVVSKGIEPE